ncbi:uncharacterized protein YkwD [Amycolatopsis bartoniae]|uniref:CAP domain-containing protein n=1 Tax=Amycolatopsis bartoniae TaxID=941986 RepID=UPI0017ECD844|nr:CAP domain-containing protein [Amycolatopsis bartoniae]MBB2938467.1 uncharacterized protein YkwD [Amycolatopsis bartoniae]
MPTSRKRKRRDGTVARFRPPEETMDVGVLGKPSRPVPEAELEPAGDPSFRSVVGSTEHQRAAEDAVVRLSNAARARAGLRPLRSDERLRTAARAHSKDMAQRDFCAHINPDGRTPGERMSAAGYPAPGAENVARGQDSPHKVVQAWLDSPGHRANLLNPEFTTIGAGAYYLGDGGPCWTQNFGY